MGYKSYIKKSNDKAPTGDRYGTYSTDLFIKLEVELAGWIGDALEALLPPSSHLHLSPSGVTQMAETWEMIS